MAGNVETGEVKIAVSVDPSKGEQGAKQFEQVFDQAMTEVVHKHDEAREAAKRQVEALVELERSFDEVKEHAKQQVDALGQVARQSDEVAAASGRAHTSFLTMVQQGGARLLHWAREVIVEVGKMALAILGAEAAIHGLKEGFGGLIESNREVENIRIGTAAVVNANLKWTDSLGRVLDKHQALNESMKISSELMKRFRVDQFSTTNTAKELEEIAQTLSPTIAPLAKGKGDLTNRLEKMSVLTSLAAGAVGVNKDLAASEVDMMIGGHVSVSQMPFARKLGFTPEMVEQMKKGASEALDVIEKRLKDFEPAAIEHQHSWDGITSSLREIQQVANQEIGHKTFELLKDDLNGIKSLFVVLDKDGVAHLNPQFEHMADLLGGAVAAGFKGIEGGARLLIDVAKALSDNAPGIGGAAAAITTFTIALNWGNVVTGASAGIKALGVAYQWMAAQAIGAQIQIRGLTIAMASNPFTVWIAAISIIIGLFVQWGMQNNNFQRLWENFIHALIESSLWLKRTVIDVVEGIASAFGLVPDAQARFLSRLKQYNADTEAEARRHAKELGKINGTDTGEGQGFAPTPSGHPTDKARFLDPVASAAYEHGPNEMAVGHIISQMRNKYAKGRGVQGMKDELAALQEYGRTHHMAGAAADKLAGEEHRLEDQIKKRTEAEARATERAHRAAERHAAAAERHAVTSDKSSILDLAGRVGAENVFGPFTRPEEAALGKVFGRQVIDHAKERTATNDLFKGGLSGELKAWEDALKSLQSAPFKDSRAIAEVISKIADIKDKIAKATASGLKEGVEIGKDLMTGNFEDLGKSLQKDVSDALIDAASRNPAVQDAVKQLGQFFTGPQGLAIAFGAALILAIGSAVKKAKEEADAFAEHVNGIAASGYRNDAEQLADQIRNDPYAQKLRQSNKDLEASMSKDKHDLAIAKDADTKRIAENNLKAHQNSMNQNTKALEALTTAYRQAKDLKNAEDVGTLMTNTALDTHGIRNQIKVLDGGMSSFAASADALDIEKSKALTEYTKKYGSMANSEDEGIRNRFFQGFNWLKENFDEQKALLQKQLEVQQKQLQFAEHQSSGHIANRMALATGQISQQEFSLREGRMNLADSYRQKIQSFEETHGIGKTSDADLGDLGKVTDFLKTGALGEDGKVLLQNLEDELKLLQIESQRGDTASNPVYVRDVDRDRAFPLDTAIYMRMLASGAASKPNLQVLEGGASGSGGDQVVVHMGGVTVDARGVDPSEIDSRVAGAMTTYFRSPQGMRAVRVAANNGARLGSGNTGAS